MCLPSSDNDPVYFVTKRKYIRGAFKMSEPDVEICECIYLCRTPTQSLLLTYCNNGLRERGSVWRVGKSEVRVLQESDSIL